MSAAPQLFEKLLTIPARSRQGAGTLRSRLFGTDKAKKEGQILRTSLAIHRPVWHPLSYLKCTVHQVDLYILRYH
ncbi:hypothetical protein DTO164E3_949 [Paecilomyces variotii]|nr:hypothetical protein DTO164E3_949 [Paecilomyces variotii]